MNQVLANWKISLLYFKLPIITLVVFVAIFLLIMLIWNVSRTISIKAQRVKAKKGTRNKQLQKLVQNTMGSARRKKLLKMLAIANDPRSPEEFWYDVINSGIVTFIIGFLIDVALMLYAKYSHIPYLFSSRIWATTYIPMVTILPAFVMLRTWNVVDKAAEKHKMLVFQQLPLYTRLIQINLSSGVPAREAVERAIEYLPEKGLKEDIKAIYKLHPARNNLTKFFELLGDRIDMPQAQRFFNSLTVLDRMGDTEFDRKHVISLLNENLLSYDREREYRMRKAINAYDTPAALIITVFFVGSFAMSLVGGSVIAVLKILGR
ncbi:MAG: hypothetical protein J7L03_02425 [Caldisericaceae bacterium]|nr:hypothetical protein [Caldisericaceae bacterium]